MVKQDESISVNIGKKAKKDFDLICEYKNLGKRGRNRYNQGVIAGEIIEKYVDDLKKTDEKFVEYIDYVKKFE